MLAALLFSLVLLQPCLNVAHSPREDSQQFGGCVTVLGLRSPGAARDLDPVTGSAGCSGGGPEGLFLLTVGVNLSPDREQHRHCAVDVSGHSAGQRSHGVDVLDDASFVVLSDWIYKINASFCSFSCQKNTEEERTCVRTACSLTCSLVVRPAASDLKPHTENPDCNHASTTCDLCSLDSVGPNVGISLLLNATLLYTNSSYSTEGEAVAVLLCNHTETVVVELGAENRASSQKKSVRLCLEGKRKPSPQVNPPTVRIYAAKKAYPTNTDITFTAVTDELDPVEFIWHFGDSRSSRTTLRTVTKRYNKPGRFDVVAVMSKSQTSVTSEVFSLEVQRAVKLSRLVHQASVLQNQTIVVTCWVNVGTNLTFLWSFGEGSSRLGQRTEEHVFNRTGEFRVTVSVSNLVSSASLSSHIFVVDRHCQPPPVKNMGPLKLQVLRYEVIHLGVTYDSEMDCDVSGGLHYTWVLLDSAGQVFPLPLTDTHRQRLILPGHLLLCDTYTATATVGVFGSVVYSNYSVKIEVMPSPPVAFIQGGTNIFINSTNTTLVTLDGRRSYDPDFPLNTLSYSWTCNPISSISSSCFTHYIPTSEPALTFPVSFLKHNFDQFQFTLSIHSREQSASAQSFLTVMPNVLRKVSVYCSHCQGDQVKWDQPFSVRASCEDGDLSPQHIQYNWHLYLVNASSRPVTEVPFCHTVDLSAPSTIIKGPVAASPHSSAIDSSHHSPTLASFLITEITSETTTKKPNHTVQRTNSGATSNKRRNMSYIAGVSQLEPYGVSEGSGDEPFYHPPAEFDPPEYHSSTENPSPAIDISENLYSDYFSDVISEFPVDSGSSADWGFSFPVLELDSNADSNDDGPLPSAKEGDSGISAGRPTGEGDTFSLEGDWDPALGENEGSNLVDSRPSVEVQEPTLLDLPRDPVHRSLFESYTSTGISSSLLSFRPFSLKPASRYMLEVTAKSDNRFVGRTQLFLKTKPAPKGMRCLVQPVKGTELHTHFSIFCTSGKEDLVYTYSFSVRGRRRRTLYQGRDFQYYFRLPSGDASDDYQVTVFTEIRSSTYGTSTEACSVTVQVQPSFLRDSSHGDPDLELSESGLRNLSALVQLGNTVESRNYISLLSNILNRLSLDVEANTHAQRHVRNVLIYTVCQLESTEQQSMEDNISILTDLLQITNQVSLVSVRQVTIHIQAISEQFLDFSAPVLTRLITLLSYTLQSAVAAHYSTLETFHSVPITHKLGSDSLAAKNTRNSPAAPDGCRPDSSTSVRFRRGRMISSKLVAHSVADILETASDLMLKYMLSHGAQEHRVNTGLIALYSTYQNSSVISSGSTTLYFPTSLHQQLFVDVSQGGVEDQPCVLSVLSELTDSPYTWAPSATQLSGRVVDLRMYKCSTRRKIHVRPVIQPITIELQHPQTNKTSLHEYVLLHNQVNYHSFNITQEHLQQSIQFSVTFTPLQGKVFPIMLLFRMFDRPTSSMHHLHRIHSWESNSTRITLPPSYLSAAGIGHLALLNAGKAPRYKHVHEQINYSLSVESSLCLLWDGQQEAWTPRGCRTHQADTDTAVSCSCHQLKPLTVVQQPIKESHDMAHLDSFLSVSSDLSVLGVLLLCVCLYIPGLVLCKKADVASKQNLGCHYLPDNSPSDPYLYAATIHNGLCSAACMSAKVYIVLYGEDGTSQTRELHVPGCTLFRRNSKDTFILSTAHSLGSVWGVHIWHDNSGPSPNWYLKQMDVSEVNKETHVKGRAWIFVGQCWLSVSEGDGQVERKLHVCTQGIGFAKNLCLKLCDYLADFHIWMSVFCCPRPSLFTHTQRLTVCLLLFLGYACVNTVIISQMDDQLPFESGLVDVSAVSVLIAVSSVLAVFPTAAVISLLFRWHKVKLMESGLQHTRTEKDCFKDGLSEYHQLDLQQQSKILLSVSTTILENKVTDKELEIQSDVVLRNQDALEAGSIRGPVHQNVMTGGKNVGEAHQSKVLSSHSPDHSFWRRLRPTSQWCHYLAWALCLLLSLSCLLLSALLGIRFSSSKVLLWIHSLFFSLILCIFFIQPVLILAAAVIVSFWYRKTDFHRFSRVSRFEIETCKLWSCNVANCSEEQKFRPTAVPQERNADLEELLRVRQRVRYLRLVRPPTQAELRKTRGQKQRETLLHHTLRDLFICVSMLLLVLCIICGNSLHNHYHLNRFIRAQFMRNQAFMSIQKHEDWWKWTQTSLLNSLYRNASARTEQSHILIGEPILWKTEVSRSTQSQVSSLNIVLERLQIFLLGNRASKYLPTSNMTPMTTSLSSRGHLGCFSGQSATVGLGYTKLDAVSKLKQLHCSGWLDRQTVVLKVQFTLYSPAAGLFSSVTLLAEQSPTGVLLPSSKVQSVSVYHTPTVWNYVAMTCQLLFLLLSLLQLCFQLYTVGQQGLMGYCRTPYNWLEVTLLTVTLLYYVYNIHHSVITMDVVELLQKHSYRRHVDVSLLATWEQHIRTLRGITFFLLTTKGVTVLRVNRTLDPSIKLLTHSLSSLFWPMISGFIVVVALSCVGNLLFVHSSVAFRSIPHSLQTLVCHHWGLMAVKDLLLSGHDFIYCGVLYLSSMVAWTGGVMAVMSSVVRSSRRLKSRRNVFTVAELASYIRKKISEVTSQQRPIRVENHVERKVHRYIEESPISSPTEERSSMDIEGFVSDHTDVSDHRESPSVPHLLRSTLELKILQLLQQRSQRRHSPSSHAVVASEFVQHLGKRAENPNDRELHTFRPNYLSFLEPTSLNRVLDEQTVRWTKAQATHTEVVVKALVHEEPGSVEPHKQQSLCEN